MFVSDALEHEQGGNGEITPYTDSLGRLMLVIKRKWPKLTVAEREEFRPLRCFQDMFTDPAHFEDLEWDRMFRLCLEFEAEHKCAIAPRQTVGENPIGKWLSIQKGLYTKSRTDRRIRCRINKLQQLRTFREWIQTRRMSDNETFQASWDAAVDGLNRAARNLAPSSSSKTSAKETCYDLLGVGRTASDELIRSAYRLAALKHHPDKGGDQSVYLKISKAYEILADPVKRKAYDKSLDNIF